MAKPATAVDPQTTFTPAELSQSFQQYRTELIVMPMLAMQAALQHMTARTGIRYQQHVHEMKGNFEIGPYDKYKKGVDISSRHDGLFGKLFRKVAFKEIRQNTFSLLVSRLTASFSNRPQRIFLPSTIPLVPARHARASAQ